VHILGFAIGDGSSIPSESLEKYKIRLAVLTAFWFIDHLEISQLGKEVAELRTIAVLGGTAAGKGGLDTLEIGGDIHADFLCVVYRRGKISQAQT